MNRQSINITTRAYAALLASCARTVLAQDAMPILATDIDPLLRNGWRRSEIERGLANKLRGKLAADSADPLEVAKKLLSILHEPGKDTLNGKRRLAKDGLSSEMLKTLRSKLDGKEYDAIMAALGNGNFADEEPGSETDYEKQQFGDAGDPRDPHDSQIEPDATDDSCVSKSGFGKDGDLSERIMQLVGPHLSDEDKDGLQSLLDQMFGDDDEAQDEPPEFSGAPRAGGKQMPLSTKPPRNPLPSTAMDADFAKRWPEAARMRGASNPTYRDGVPVVDPRLLVGTTPAPRRHAAMDSAMRRPSKSFEQRFPDAARIRRA